MLLQSYMVSIRLTAMRGNLLYHMVFHWYNAFACIQPQVFWHVVVHKLQPLQQFLEVCCNCRPQMTKMLCCEIIFRPSPYLEFHLCIPDQNAAFLHGDFLTYCMVNVHYLVQFIVRDIRFSQQACIWRIALRVTSLDIETFTTI